MEKLRRGKYVVLEGLDRMGKSTIRTALEVYAKSIGHNVEIVYTDRIAGNRVPAMLGNYPDEIAYMFFWQAIRYSEIVIVEKALTQGTIVLGDRNFLSNLSYDLWTDLDLEFMRQMEQIYYPLCIKPDMSIILTASYECFQRRDDGDTKLSQSDFINIQQNYKHWGNRLISDGYIAHFVDSSGTMEEVREKVFTLVCPLLDECVLEIQQCIVDVNMIGN